MTEEFDIEQQWPELFEQFNAEDRRAVVQSLAAAWHEGWEPNREDIENLTDKVRGAIDGEEYKRRVRQAAERYRAVAAPGEARSSGVAEKFDIEQQWPELFEQLDAIHRHAVVESLAAAWHEGWEPNREDVENLSDRARGAIDGEEYLRRVDAAAERRRE
ncbi:hypothetical protein N2K95_01215 [Arthrobacter zhaoxinii]|uniref:Antitoxin VbhA domain-containing protein n=1 Tax=Arthrobacter zhaoxinii TaxID=2964616 RepID=A0ABY5YQJ1_9MICC|nr:hypothetical protein [Arthrobacter zhaoxinii]UWX97347.1 hypothetical protein N2K95_01215 [Arthrobacter zhaoxinii]